MLGQVMYLIQLEFMVHFQPLVLLGQQQEIQIIQLVKWLAQIRPSLWGHMPQKLRIPIWQAALGVIIIMSTSIKLYHFQVMGQQ